MTTGQVSRERMLARLEQYASLRDGGDRPGDAAQAMGISVTSGARYERWYREQAGLPRRQPGYGDPMPDSGVRGVYQ